MPDHPDQPEQPGQPGQGSADSPRAQASATPGRERPFWTVIGVFDPDGEGADFSYTVGLAERGLPELHLWARPTEGLDPAPDWAFSPRDRGMLLNELARDLLAGRVQVGDEFTREYDAGTATATFRLDPATTRENLDAFQAAADATVIPVRWSLSRTPEGRLGPLTSAATDDASLRIAKLAAEVRWDPTIVDVLALPVAKRDRRSPFDPADSPAPHFDPQQVYGPLTPLVIAYAARVMAASTDELAAWCHNAVLTDTGAGPRHVLALTSAAARPVGRSAALAKVHQAAHAVVERLSAGASGDGRFPELVDRFTEVPLPPGRERDQMADSVRHLLTMAAAALLSTVAVVDVAGEDLERAGLGPWSWALADTFTAPDPLWHAPEEVLARVRSVLDPLDVPSLLALAQAHLSALEDDAYADVAGWLRAQQLTQAAGTPDLALFLSPASARHLAATAGAAALDDVSDVVAALVAATARRSLMHDPGVEVLCSALGPACPGVRYLLSST